MAAYRTARLQDMDEIEIGGRFVRPIRHHLGITTFGINAMVAREAGDSLVGEHSEDQPESAEELYIVVNGRATFEIDGETQDAPAGTYLQVPPGVTRSAVAAAPDTTVLIVGAGPAGKPYEPTGWELFAPLFPLFDSEQWEEGADRAQAIIADDPPYGFVYYNTACFESRAGRLDDAIAHLRRAVELAPSLVELIPEDEDFEPLHGHPGFAAIVGEPA